MSAGNDPPKILHPPNRLKAKVGRGSGTLPATATPAFQALMQTGAADYSRHLDRQIRELRALVTEGGSGAADTVVAIAHQIRGEAGTFGYACLGCCARSLCMFIEAGGHTHARGGEVLGLYMDIMAKLKAGSDGRDAAATATLAQTLFGGLDRAVRHVLKPPCGGAGLPGPGCPCRPR